MQFWYLCKCNIVSDLNLINCHRWNQIHRIIWTNVFLSLRSSIECPGFFRISLRVFKVDYFFQKVTLKRILYDCILHQAHEHAQSPVITYIIVSNYGNLFVHDGVSNEPAFWFSLWINFFFTCCGYFISTVAKCVPRCVSETKFHTHKKRREVLFSVKLFWSLAVWMRHWDKIVCTAWYPNDPKFFHWIAVVSVAIFVTCSHGRIWAYCDL